jgi:excinuclease ABC subunit A
MWSTSAPAPGVHGGEIIAQGTPATSWPTPPRSPAVSLRRTARSGPGRAPQADQKSKRSRSSARRGNNLKGRASDPARHLHLRHRRLGRRQVHLPDRDALQGRRAALNGARETRRRTTGSTASNISTRSSTSTSRRSAARRARTPPPTPAPSPDPRLVRGPAGGQGARLQPGRFSSTSRAAAARPARATASSRSRCTSCPTSTSPATSARASATTARRWRSPSRASRSPTCST